MTISEPDAAPAVDLDSEIRRLRALLEDNRFAEVERMARPLLTARPGHRDLLYLLAVALRMQKRIPEALEVLTELEAWHPGYPRLFQERGHCHIFYRDAPAAIAAFERAVNLNPALPASWSALQALYRMSGRHEDSQQAAQHVAKLDSLPTEIVTARSMLADGNAAEAELVVREFLSRNADNIEALRLLANIAARSEYAGDAEKLLGRVLQLAPDYHAARYDFALALIDVQKHARARAELEKLIAIDPANAANHITLAGVLVAIGEVENAIASYQRLIERFPDDPRIVQSLGHAYKAMGDQGATVDAYRRAAALRPGFGEAYWSLANLKVYRFEDAEIDRMRELEAMRKIQPEDRIHLCFALGKALEDRAEYAESFRYYASGNALKKQEAGYRGDIYERQMRRQRELFDAAFFAARRNWGCPDSGPIFIFGLPRAGSTLLEQILASHSQAEGTQELANVPRLVSALGGREQPGDKLYPATLADLPAEEYRGFGEEYLADTLDYRSGRPYFIDKMPNNFRNVPLIHLMLPNARLIDARRAPLDCCFSNFKQLYARGHHFAYDLTDIGRYYSAYVELMEHWERELPGRILRVQHEQVIEDLEGQVRRILDYCGLPFEPACVEFHKTQRNVHTASSEQVRRPINREGMDQWKPYVQWLGPLIEALGPLAQLD